MAKFSRLRVLNAIIETGLVPIFYNGDVDVATKIVQALLAAGVQCIEFTNRGDRAWQLFADDRIGSLEVGKLADLTVVDRNPLEIDPATLDQVGVRETWLGGRRIAV